MWTRIIGACVLGAWACETGDEAGARAEAAQIRRAIQVLRQAPHDAKEIPLGVLKALSCNGDRCDAKDTCVEAYTLHVRSMDSLRAVRQATKGTGDPVPTAELLSRSQSMLERSKKLGGRCADLEGELVRRHDLE